MWYVLCCGISTHFDSIHNGNTLLQGRAGPVDGLGTGIDAHVVAQPPRTQLVAAVPVHMKAPPTQASDEQRAVSGGIAWLWAARVRIVSAIQEGQQVGVCGAVHAVVAIDVGKNCGCSEYARGCKGAKRRCGMLAMTARTGDESFRVHFGGVLALTSYSKGGLEG